MLIRFLRGGVIPLIFPKVPQSSLGIRNPWGFPRDPKKNPPPMCQASLDPPRHWRSQPWGRLGLGHWVDAKDGPVHVVGKSRLMSFQVYSFQVQLMSKICILKGFWLQRRSKIEDFPLKEWSVQRVCVSTWQCNNDETCFHWLTLLAWRRLVA